MHKTKKRWRQSHCSHKKVNNEKSTEHSFAVEADTSSEAEKIFHTLPPLSSPSHTRQVKWPVSKEKKSIKYPKDTYAELVFPYQCFENWEKKKTVQINTTLSDQDLVIAFVVKIDTHKMKKENKTKQRTTQMESWARNIM